ncbi:Hsp70 protein-domain-containing protein [Aspergillus unguis]
MARPVHLRNAKSRRCKLTLAWLCLVFLFAYRVRAAPDNTGSNATEKLIGIHLGAANSRVGVLQNGEIRILANGDGREYIPSYVSASETGLVVGDAEKTLGFNLFKGMLDMKEYFAGGPPRPDAFSYTVEDGRQVLQIEDLWTCYAYSPEEVYAALISKLKDIAEMHIGPNIAGAVVTSPLPDSSLDLQKAGELAGLPIVKHMPESTGIIMALGLDELSYESDRYVLLYDLSEDFQELTVSIVEINTGMIDTLAKVRQTGLLEHFYQARYKDLSGLPPPRSPTERKYIEWILDEPSMLAIDRVSREARLDSSSITDVVLMPTVRKLPHLHGRLSSWFTNARVVDNARLDEAPVWGAAMMSSWLAEDEWIPCLYATHLGMDSLSSGFTQEKDKCKM